MLGGTVAPDDRITFRCSAGTTLDQRYAQGQSPDYVAGIAGDDLAAAVPVRRLTMRLTTAGGIAPNETELKSAYDQELSEP